MQRSSYVLLWVHTADVCVCVCWGGGYVEQKGRGRGINIVGITHVPLSQVPVAEPPVEEGEEAASGDESAPAKVRGWETAGLQHAPTVQHCGC